MIFHQHVTSWNHQIIESSKTVVFSVESLLRTNVSSLNSRNCLKSLRISNRNQKSVKTIIFSINYELSKESSVSTVNSQISDPPFRGSDGWTVDNKSLILFVVSCSCL